MQTVFERYGKAVTLAIPEDVATARSALSPMGQYLWDYGWKQSLSDAYAAAKNADEFEGKLRARYDAILAGTVKSPGTGVSKGPRLSPLEREMLRIATNFMDAVLAKRPKKTSKEDRQVYIDLYLEREREAIREQAEANLAANAERVAESADILDQLLAEAAQSDEMPSDEEIAESETVEEPRKRKR